MPLIYKNPDRYEHGGKIRSPRVRKSLSRGITTLTEKGSHTRPLETVFTQMTSTHLNKDLRDKTT